MTTLPTIDELIARGAVFVINHSGGKDSQCMFHVIRDWVPHDQIIVIHAVLPEVEWPGVEEHVYATTMGLPTFSVQAGKTFFEMVERRHESLTGRGEHDVSPWPSPETRQCTSDLKRGPIETAIRRYLKAHPRFNGLIVNCMGLRAEESSNRAKQKTFKFSERNSKAGREWYEWLPIHDLLVDDVFRVIREHGQEPHWAYAAGMSRLSCCFCIMASMDDLGTAARLNPTLLRRYVDLERKTGKSMLMPVKGQRRFLEDLFPEVLKEAA